MINEVLTKMKNYIDNPMDSFEFSLELEDLLYENYDMMHKENTVVTDFLNETLPDICASYNDNCEKEFIEKIKEQYELTLQLYSERNGCSC